MKKLLIIIAAALMSSCTAPKLITTNKVTIVPNEGEAFTLEDVKIDWYINPSFVWMCPAHDTAYIDRRNIRIEGETIRHQQKKAVFIYE